MKPYPFLKGNLKALQSQNAPVYPWLSEHASGHQNSGTSIILNQRGFLDWRLPSGQGLFEDISPETAYRNWGYQDQDETGATVIVGCNLGYGLNHILSNSPEAHRVLVLEPRPEMLLACLGHTDYRPFLEKKRLFFIPPMREGLEGTTNQLILPCRFGRIYLRSDLPSRQLGPDYARWSEYCREFLEDLSVELHTVRLRQDTMIRNELNNFQRAMGEGSLMTLKGKAGGLTAVILGAGPSLDRFATHLAENPGGALYATSLQTLPALRRHGLKPHLCMAIECHEAFLEVYNHLDLEWARDIPLIYSTTVTPEVVKTYPGPTVPMWTVGGLASHILQGRELLLDVAGNVGVALTRFLTWCGAERMLLVGQDFSWPGERTHVRGHLATGSAFQFDPKFHIRLKNREGETIYSAQPYLTALRALERDLEQLKIPVLHLYGGGAVIKGTLPVTWEDVLSEGTLKSASGSPDRFVGSITQAPSSRPWPRHGKRSPKWIASLNTARKRLDRLSKKPKKHRREIRTALEKILSFIQQDPLYRPYILNEMINLAGLIHSKGSYGMKDLAQCRQILRKVTEKVREIERYLVPCPDNT